MTGDIKTIADAVAAIEDVRRQQAGRKIYKGDYHLTEAGVALSKAVFAVGMWGQEWLTTLTA